MTALLDPRAWTVRSVVTAWILLAGGPTAYVAAAIRWPLNPLVRWAGQPAWYLADYLVACCLLVPIVYAGAQLFAWGEAWRARGRQRTR